MGVPSVGRPAWLLDPPSSTWQQALTTAHHDCYPFSESRGSHAAIAFSRPIEAPNQECSRIYKRSVGSRLLAFSRCRGLLSSMGSARSEPNIEYLPGYPHVRLQHARLGVQLVLPRLQGILPIRRDPWGSRPTRQGKASAAAALPSFADSHGRLAGAEPLCVVTCQSPRRYWCCAYHSGRSEPSSVASNAAGDFLDRPGQKQAREQTGGGYILHVLIGSLGPVSSLLVHRCAAGSIPRVEADADGTMPRVTR